MNRLFQPFVKNKRQQDLLSMVASLADKVKDSTKEMDEKADFSIRNLETLKTSGYTSLPLPEEFGGQHLSLYEFVLLQERLAIGDGSTALSLGWHIGVLMELRDEKLWDEKTFRWLANEVSEKKKIVNRAASEPATGSPTRGGIPETNAKEKGNYYIVNGKKTFTSMASVLDYYIVSVYINELEQVGWLLVPSNTPGVSVDKTWDTLGMRGTGSHDLILKDVKLDKSHLVELASKKSSPKGWLMHIPACYLGIAFAARNDAIQFANEFQPNTLDTPISEVHHIQQKIGEMDIKLMNARHFMYSIAEKWDENIEDREQLGSSLAAVKYVATNTANEVVDLAMRIVGGRGLSRNFPFEKYYRDVRAGLHNPPMDDAVLQTIAREAINDCS